ncbi:DUF4352 domain-containing protein [Streptomyces sp. N35]|uniref:DUF4352 domain-containing protein n=1 Tax=Streptomyces sp. N35 TaxID=2795730 RepID=UPI0018F3F050|nr:DUF4352 domain-containing protein [Streptomyces sp. N35]
MNASPPPPPDGNDPPPGRPQQWGPGTPQQPPPWNGQQQPGPGWQHPSPPPPYGQPPYGAPPQPPKKSPWKWIALGCGGLLILVAGGCAALIVSVGSDEGKKPEKVTSSASGARKDETASSQETFRVGDTIAADGWELKVNKVIDPFVSGNQFSTPEAGKRFIVVDLTVKNTKDRARTASSFFTSEVRDEDGRAYRQTIVVGVDQAPDGEVAPGEQRTGQMAFEVPTDARTLRLDYSTGLFLGERVVIDLTG